MRRQYTEAEVRHRSYGFAGLAACEGEGSIPYADEGAVARRSGGYGREDAGMSNEKTGEKPVRRKPKVSWVKVIFPG